MKPSIMQQLTTNVLLVLLLFSASYIGPSRLALAAGQDEGELTVASADGAEPGNNYSNLHEMITRISADAAVHFQGFFAAAVTTVRPFIFYDDSEQQITVLGMTLADQLQAALNHAVTVKRGGGSFTQQVKGIMQEIDGYLRLHVSGINASGEARDYVVNIEMSEPIYRALHTPFSVAVP